MPVTAKGGTTGGVTGSCFGFGASAADWAGESARRGSAATVAPAWAALLQGLKAFDVKLGPELVRNQ